MNIIELRNKVRELNKQAESLIGEKFYYPLSKILECDTDEYVQCEVTEILLPLNSVVFSYLLRNKKYYESMSIDQYTKISDKIVKAMIKQTIQDNYKALNELADN